MKSTTLISQHSSGRRRASVAGLGARSGAVAHVNAPTATPVNPTATYMAWLGGVDEKVCFLGQSVIKRITTGRLERCLT